MPDTATRRIADAATTRPLRAIAAATLMLVAGAAMRTAEALLDVPAGTIGRASDEYEAARNG